MSVLVRPFALCDYLSTYEAMRAFTTGRQSHTPDEIWLVEHPSVYTTGVRGAGAATREPLGGVPIIATDRGGLLTYHGPGQLVLYPLLDLGRRRFGVRAVVAALEQAVIDVLAQYALCGERHAGAPGVYVAGRKIASLGLRVRGGALYHGLSFNVDMDLAPFRAIDPCGLAGMDLTQLADLGVRASVMDVAAPLLAALCGRLDIELAAGADACMCPREAA